MSEKVMRAKLQVGMVQEHFMYDPDPNAKKEKSGETLKMHAVCKSSYDGEGLDEDNTFAKYSPGATLSINVANPELWGKFKHGDKFYVDFTRAD
jgi:hypothetical protein